MNHNQASALLAAIVSLVGMPTASDATTHTTDPIVLSGRNAPVLTAAIVLSGEMPHLTNPNILTDTIVLSGLGQAIVTPPIVLSGK